MKTSFTIGAAAYTVSAACIATALVLAETQYTSAFLFIAIISLIIGGCAMALHMLERLDRSLTSIESKLYDLDRRVFDELDRQDESIRGTHTDAQKSIDAVRREMNDDIRELSHSIKKHKDKAGI